MSCRPINRLSARVAALATCVALAAYAPSALAQPDDEEEEPEEGGADDEGDDDDDEGEEPSEEDSAEEDRTEEDRTEEDRTEEDRAEEDEPAMQDAQRGENAARGSDAQSQAPNSEAAGLADSSYPRVVLGGYVEGGFGFRLRPEALPKDEIDYGFFGVAGLAVEGWAHEMWNARIRVEFRSDALDTVTDVELFDLDGDAAPEVASFTVSPVPGIVIQEATAGFQPAPLFSIVAGITRIPFTLAQQSKNNALMFPSRAPANEIFLSGADLGALAKLDIADGVFITSLGAFNGDSLGLRVSHAEPRGVVLAYRADVNPFGRFRFGEGDLERGPFRLGAGFGLTFWPATLFDERTGTEPRTLNDLRLSGSLRMAWRGLYAVVEYFRRQQDDDFSFRPEVADGAYGQLAYFIPLGDDYGLEPMVRPGFVAADQTFDPRITGYIDAGFNFYPIAGTATPDAVKLTLAYLGERRFSEQEEAHGGAVALRINF